MTRPVADDVSIYLGKTVDPILAWALLNTVSHMVRAYTRGRGFEGDDPADDLAAVIVSATARAVSNPEHTVEQTTGPFSVRPGIFNGWTLPELAILHRYRKRAL